MKLNFKDLKQQKFTIDAEPAESVADVKAKVAAEKGFEAANIKLIWSGKILADAQEIGSYEIKPADHIVCMVSKPKPAPAAAAAPAPAPSTPAPVAAQTPAAPAPAPVSSSTGANAPGTPTPAQANRPFNDPSSMTLGAERQAAISNMEAMGFDRAQCERAFRAAYYNADRAVEYLLNGIPESAETQAPPAAQTTSANTQPSRPSAPPSAATTQTPSSAPAPSDDEPVNLFDAAAAQGAGRGGAAGGAAAANINPLARGAAGAGPGAPGGPNVGGPVPGLESLRGNATFQSLRQTLQQNPGMLGGVLQQLASSNPVLAQQIQENPEAFMQLLMEGDGDEDAIPPGAQSVSVTEAERDAIERLCRLGFERDLVIQAYFACDKNEELAANFLFENPDDEGQ